MSKIKELQDSGVAVFTADFSMLDETLHGTKLNYGILNKKDQNGNPDDYSNYTASNILGDLDENTLLIPSGDRTVASASKTDGYRHDSQASTSWTVPTLAGIYTCALQCAKENNIEFNQAKFMEYALKTGVPIKGENGQIEGKAINAEALINYIKSLNPSS